MVRRKTAVFAVAFVLLTAAFMVPSVPFQHARSIQLAFADQLRITTPTAVQSDDEAPCLQTDAYRSQGFPFIYRVDIVEPCGNASIRNYLAATLDVIAAGINAAAVTYLFMFWQKKRKPRQHSRLKRVGSRL